MKLVIERSVPDIQVHCTSGGVTYATRGYDVLASADSGKTWEPVIRLPASGIRQYTHPFGIMGRLLRAGPLYLNRIGGHGFFAQLDRQLVRLGKGGLIWSWSLARGARTLRTGILLYEDSVLIGDYWSNEKREPVSIWKIDLATGRAEPLLTFDAGYVRHVHAIQHDPFSDAVWVTTGDEDPECRVGKLNAVSGDVEWVGGGSQTWRAVSLVFKEEAVYWGTDDPDGQNHIVRLDRESGAVEETAPVSGPVYYARDVGPITVFTTAVEKRGEEEDSRARVYALDESEEVLAVWEIEKDVLPSRAFGYGVIELGLGDAGDDRFWMTPKGLAGRTGSHLCRLERD